MLLPSSIQRADDFVGMATPTVPLSCAWAAPMRPKAPRATAAIAVVNVFKVVLPLVHAQALVAGLAQSGIVDSRTCWAWRLRFRLTPGANRSIETKPVPGQPCPI